jgi:CRP/FNR family transcriptional regulator
MAEVKARRGSSSRRPAATRAPAPRAAHPLLPMLLSAPAFGTGLEPRPLTPRERQKLANAATRLQLPDGFVIYREGDPAESIFINGGGVVVSYKELPSGQRRVAGFRFHTDLLGLADEGAYVNTTRAVTPVTLFRIPAATLVEILKHDAELEFQFLCKVVDNLREAQRKSIIVARRDAAGRVAMFLDLLQKTGRTKQPRSRVELPMTRSDMAGFLNLTLESVSRACRRLSDQGIVTFDRDAARIVNRRRFDEMVAAL